MYHLQSYKHIIGLFRWKEWLMKKKRIIITISIIIISIILLYFVKVQVQNSAAKEIINNLANENYMYTKTVSSEFNNEKA